MENKSHTHKICFISELVYVRLCNALLKLLTFIMNPLIDSSVHHISINRSILQPRVSPFGCGIRLVIGSYQVQMQPGQSAVRTDWFLLGFLQPLQANGYIQVVVFWVGTPYPTTP